MYVWYNEFSAVIEFEYMDSEPVYGAINRQPPFNMLVWGLLKLTSIKFCTDSWYPTVMLKSQYQLCVKKEGTTK